MLGIILVIGFIGLFLLLALVAMALYQVILQNGRMLARLEAVERAALPWDDARIGVEEYMPTLPKGVRAPDVRLPDLNGIERSLSEWRGQRVLLVFMDPACSFSRALLPSLVSLASDPVPGRPQPVIVTTGDFEENRRLFDGAGFSGPVLIQEGTEVAGAYKVDGTPMSYLINEDGTTADAIATGVQAILIQAGEMAAVADATETVYGAAPPPALDGTVKLREGLAVGSPAPLFRLPALDGSQVSLLDYRGRSLIVVFTDPDCPPCDELAPRLQEAHRRSPGLAMLLISQGEAEEVRAKVAEQGLTIPVALQRHWEISREFGIFANPAAFLIDEWGTICAAVAVGPDQILDLIESVERGDFAD